MPTQFTAEYVSQLLSAVESEFSTFLAKAEGKDSTQLAKSEDAPFDKKDEKKDDKKEYPKENKEEKPAHEAPEEKKDDKEAPAADEGKEEHTEGKEAAPDAEQGEQDHGYDDEDMKHMHEMYSSMSHGELKAHHDAVRRSLDAKGMAKCGDMGMAKSEQDIAFEIKAEVSKEVELVKSELAAEKAKSEELKKNLDAVSEFLTKFAKKTAPAGKAITSLDVITKNEGTSEEKSLTKSEITEKLVKKAADPKLSPTDKDAINAYYLNGGSIDKIRHLLS